MPGSFTSVNVDLIIISLSKELMAKHLDPFLRKEPFVSVSLASLNTSVVVRSICLVDFDLRSVHRQAGPSVHVPRLLFSLAACGNVSSGFHERPSCCTVGSDHHPSCRPKQL
ncbi:unnamed protein product [Somion occarium]|uniref:Uncharacterized protein n=1 Tax=Somion occarium TaxID=3059160 RepID=A0ABP1DGD7_9APHY